LARFKADAGRRGRVLDTGLWRYSRHPNYFGDAVFWWGLFAMAVGVGGLWTIPGPVVMTLLLLKISGVPLLEARMEETRPGYREYVRRTPAFVPWFPRGDS
jgi:steroid 5-alpha reductase family enzyme